MPRCAQPVDTGHLTAAIAGSGMRKVVAARARVLELARAIDPAACVCNEALDVCN